MRVKRIVLGGAALVAACAITGDSYQSWKGMLVARPAMGTVSLEHQLIGLTDYREVWVYVQGVPDALKDKITKQDIGGWTANRLKNIGLHVVTLEQAGKTLLAAPKDTDEKALVANDRFGSDVIVSVSADRLPTGAIYANVSLQCKRGVFVHPGYYRNATAWDENTLVYFGAANDPKEQIREHLNRLLDKLESDWKKCNP